MGALKNVLYVEPNYSPLGSYTYNSWSYENSNYHGSYFTAPDLEEYCIAVDFFARVPERQKNGNIKTNEKIFGISYHDGEKTNVNFFSGTRFAYDGERSGNYYSTMPYEVTTAHDVATMVANGYSTTEMLGIESIDIAYNNYAVPQVTIQFTDIRGISLFQPEELRHRMGTNEMGSIADADIAGSFFKCFFMFPYPKFQMTVKGFYGPPVSYTLTCSDFRAKFDASSGSFKATAKFVGYAFSLLNDVTMNALLAAPYEETFGVRYWEEKKKSDFVFDDGTTFPTLAEICASVKHIKDRLENLKKTDTQYQELEESRNTAEASSNKINKIDTILDFFRDKNNLYGGEIVYTDEGKSIVYYVPSNSKNDKIDLATKVNSFKEELKANFEKDDNLYEFSNLGKEGDYSTKYLSSFDSIAEKYGETVASKIKSSQFLNKDETKIKGGKYFYADLTNLRNKYRVEGSSSEQKRDELSKVLEQKEKDYIQEALGFNPTVENITLILLAHLETLVHSIVETSNKAARQKEDRTLSKLGLTETDLNITPESTCPPWPRVETTVVKNNVTVREDTWLGDLTSDGELWPEINLITGLVNGTIKVAELIAKSPERSDGSGTTEASSVKYASSVFDLINGVKGGNKPWVGTWDKQNMADVACIATLRAMVNIGMNQGATESITDDTFKNSWKALAKCDAIEFFNANQSVNKSFIEKLKNDIFSNDAIIACLTSTTSNEISSNVNSSGEVLLKKDSNGNYILNNTITRGYVKFNKLPCSNIGSDTLRALQSREDIVSYCPSYHDFNSVNKGSRTLIFAIDKNYAKYKEFYRGIESLDDTDVKDIRDLFKGLETVDLSERYDGKSYSELFVINNDFKDVNFVASKNSCAIPLVRNADLGSFKGTIKDMRVSSFFDSIYIGSEGDSKKYKIERNDADDLAESIEDSSYLDKYCLYKIGGTKFKNEAKGKVYALRGSSSNKYCCFGDPSFYQDERHKSKEMRCGELLCSLTVNKDYYQKLVEDVTDENKLCFYAPYHQILVMGFILKTHCCHPIDYNYLSCLRKDVQEVLINEFTKWCNSDFERFLSYFELRHKNGTRFTEEEVTELYNLFEYGNGDNGTYESKIKELSNHPTKYPHFSNKGYDSFDKLFACEMSDSFFTNYISIGVSDGCIQLGFRPNCQAERELIKFFAQPCAVLKATTEIDATKNKNGYVPYLTPTQLKEYNRSFFDKLKELYQEQSETEDTASDPNGDILTAKAIKMGLYSYIKTLFDNWISGNDETIWYLKKFSPHWHFMDSYYNKVGQDIVINMEEFYNILVYSQSQEGYTLLSFLSTIYQKSHFSFHQVQNFLDMIGETATSPTIEQLFDPLPYNHVDWDNVEEMPDFIVLYTYIPSTKSDLFDDDTKDVYKGDSFLLSEENDWPLAVATKDIANGHGYAIPAFGVTYGMQYQSYFKNIDVSMENPVVTEQSLKAQFAIATAAVGQSSNGQTDTEDDKRLAFYGQDLFTIYSNNSYTCTVTMMGCAWIQPLMYFVLNNIPLFNGSYLIQKVTHKIQQGSMETTFTGTRMAKVQSPKVSDNVIYGSKVDDIMGRSGNDEEYINRRGEIASLDNDCEYKYFSPTATEGDGESMDVSMSCKSAGVDYAYDASKTTILELCAATCHGEVGNYHDKISYQSIATVLYNRKCDLKKWSSVFKHNQVAFDTSGAINFLKSVKGQGGTVSTTYVRDIMNWTKEVFDKSPSCLVGQIANAIHKGFPIFENGSPTNRKAESKAITLEDVQRIYFYANPAYFVSNKFKSESNKNGWKATLGGEYSVYARETNKNCEQFTIGSVYCYTHESPLAKEGTLDCGHIYLGYEKKGKLWESKPKPKTTETRNEYPSKAAIGLYNAICSSCRHSTAFSMTIKDIEVCPKDADGFYISAEHASDNPQLFDVILNTYYDDISKLVWCNENSNEQLPYKIYVAAKKANVKKTVYVGIKSVDSSHPVSQVATDRMGITHPYMHFNLKFYKSLKKKYGPTVSEESTAFKNECSNFYTKNDFTWYEKINRIFNTITITECPISNNSQGNGLDTLNFDGSPVVPLPKGKGLDREWVKNNLVAGKMHRTKDGQSFTLPNGTGNGWCTNAVAGYIRDCGVGWNGRCGYGYEFANFVTQNGFINITKNCGLPHGGDNITRTEFKRWEETAKKDGRLKIGDCCAMTHGAREWSKSSKGSWGHACMWNGTYWVSDWIQSTKSGGLCYGGVPDSEPFAHVRIFRCQNILKDA